MALKQSVYKIIERSEDGDNLSKIFDWFLIILISLNAIAVTLGSIDEIQTKYNKLLTYFDYFSIGIFSIEYLLRLWTAPCKYHSSKIKKVSSYFRYIFSFLGIVDLLAILPFYLPFIVNVDLRILRVLRLFRLLRILKLTRYNVSLKLINRVLQKEKDLLYITIFFMVVIILLSASVMYFVENTAQPDKFQNIPATLWWAVGALTTVGYGDVYPITILGKILGSIIAIMSIGLIAMPSGIISMGLIKEARREKKKEDEKEKEKKYCPYCGAKL